MTALHDGWTLRPLEGPVPPGLQDRAVPATVPGCVHTDLLGAGLIPDPYLDENERLLEWVGRTSWRFTTTFRAAAAAAGERVDLDFGGLDTVATVTLNGRLLGATKNMHRGHRFDVGDVLVDGDNELTVDFAAQTDAAEQMSQQLGPRPHANRHPYNAVRKMACNFGWDWGPELVTAGIWRPVTLHRWDTARLATVRPLVTVTEGHGSVEVHADVERVTGSGPVRVAATVAGRRTEVEVGADGTAVLRLDVPDPDLWWPRGHGAQPLYPLEVALLSGDTELDTWRRQVGFRTVTLDTAPDPDGTPFVIVVNGRPIQVRGANWIPDDCFPSRIDRTRYERSIGNATEAGMNLLRVWGGGIYESEDFYEICDRDGLMVWQDFLFACAAYAEEEPMLSEVVAEAREAVTRLAPHPSLVLWNGGNENIWGHEDWGWKNELGERTWGMGYYTDVLPRVVAELDPTRPYCAGSPWSLTTAHHPNDPDHGTMHIWDVWNTRDHTAYRDHVPRLASEFGYQGPPAWSTLTRAVHDDPLRPDSPGMLLHQKAEDGNAKLTRGLQPHLACAGRHGRLALGDDAAAGQGRRLRRGALPLLGTTLQRHDRVAAQRLLAGDLVGRRGRRRTAQAAVVRPPACLRRAPADRPAPRWDPGRRGGQRHRPAVDGHGGRPPHRPRRRRPGQGLADAGGGAPFDGDLGAAGPAGAPR